MCATSSCQNARHRSFHFMMFVPGATSCCCRLCFFCCVLHLACIYLLFLRMRIAPFSRRCARLPLLSQVASFLLLYFACAFGQVPSLRNDLLLLFQTFLAHKLLRLFFPWVSFWFSAWFTLCFSISLSVWISLRFSLRFASGLLLLSCPPRGFASG